MNYKQEPSDQDISISIPIKMRFIALKKILNTKFSGKVISKTNASGKENKYFKILHIDIEESNFEPYNIDFIVTIETLTTFYSKRELQISIQTLVAMDLKSQQMYVESYKIDTSGQNWMANQFIKTVLNTFIYQKIIKNLRIDLAPMIHENLVKLNEKLASKFEVKSGISILGELKHLSISRFEIKEQNIWIIINMDGWGIIDIENVEV